MSPHDGPGAQRESGAAVEDPDYIVRARDHETLLCTIPHFLLSPPLAKFNRRNARRRSQVVRQRSAKPLFVGSIPTGASRQDNELGFLVTGALPVWGTHWGTSGLHSWFVKASHRCLAQPTQPSDCL